MYHATVAEWRGDRYTHTMGDQKRRHIWAHQYQGPGQQKRLSITIAIKAVKNDKTISTTANDRWIAVIQRKGAPGTVIAR